MSVFLRAVETTIRQRSPGAPKQARFAAVAFVHRFGSYLNSHVHYHVIVSDGVFSGNGDAGADFHPALDLHDEDFLTIQDKIRKRGLSWMQRHGHLDSAAVHTMQSFDHAGGWSVNASVKIPAWDRHGLERLLRYCARPPMSQERLGRLNDKQLVYSLRKPTMDGRTELILTPVELIHKLSQLITPSRIHKHRYCGVLAPNAKLRKAVIESAGPAGSTQLLLDKAREKMAIDESAGESTEPNLIRKAAAHCWALLLVRIYECMPLLCPRCDKPMRIIAFIQDPPTIEKILTHIGEATQAPEVLPARGPPQGEMAFTQDADADDWPDMDQTAGASGDGWD